MATALAAQRAAEVLRHIARNPHESYTLTELADQLGVGTAAMHAVLVVLMDTDFVERSEESKRYRLGPEAAVLGSAARAQNDLLARAGVAAGDFSRNHGSPTTVVARRGNELVVLDGPGPGVDHSELSWPGRTIRLAAPSGGAFMAFAPHHEVLAWLSAANIEPTGTEAEDLRCRLDSIRERGWSITQRDGIHLPVVVAAPIVEPEGQPSLALVCTVSEDCSDREVEGIAAALATAAASVAEPLLQRVG